MKLTTVAMMGLLGGFLADATVLTAQQRTGQRVRRVPVTLALVDALPADVPFQILRRTETPHDVILLTTASDSAELSSAVQQLLMLRRIQGDTASAPGTLRVRHPQGSSARLRVLPWAHRVMVDLRTAPVHNLSGVGAVRSLQIFLPPQGRGAARSGGG
jgi:hypothetical protein